MKHRVNKLMALLLAVMIIITMFTGCGEKETGALRICVDLSMFSPVYQPGMGNEIDGSDQQTIMELFEAEFASYLKMNNLEPIELEIEYIPEYVREGNPERDTAIARLRTEIMSGNGPDIFILGDNDRNVEPLFSIPEKNMINGVFLPLNDYIENAQLMEFEKLVPGVMSAGQYDGEQYILPLSYTMPLTMYNADEVQDIASKTMTWNQMFEGEAYLRHAAFFIRNWAVHMIFFCKTLSAGSRIMKTASCC